MNKTTSLILAAVALTGAAVALLVGQYILAGVAVIVAALLVILGGKKR